MTRILVVEDDVEVRETLQFMLEIDSIEVVTAIDGHDAIEKLEKDKNFQMVLTDLVMPGKTGKDVIDYIKAKEINIPVIVISQHEMISEIPPNSVYLAMKKPFKIGDILMAIEDTKKKTSNP